MSINHKANCTHPQTPAARKACRKAGTPVAVVQPAHAPVAAPVAAPVVSPAVERTLAKLTAAAVRAYNTYSRAKGRNLKPVQSMAEIKAYGRYLAADKELSAFCSEHGLAAPRTW